MGEPSLWNIAPRRCQHLTSYGFNPSWESRPSGTAAQAMVVYQGYMFQPLMGEPSLWNRVSMAQRALVEIGFNPSWESRPSGTQSVVVCNPSQRRVSTPHGRAVPLERCQKRAFVARELVSTPHGRAVPLERWVTRIHTNNNVSVSTPHGRAVPLERRRWQKE